MELIKTYKTAYCFDELPDDIREKVIDNNRAINIDYNWWDFLFEDFKRIGEILGIEIDDIYFSGFSSQGDGACFTGSYAYSKGALKKIKEYAPQDKELHRIAYRLQEIQRAHFYKLEADISHTGHYNHSHCTSIDVSTDEHCSWYSDPLTHEDDLRDELRNLMDHFYSMLEKEYDYLTSDESVIETIKCNEYGFDENGDMV